MSLAAQLSGFASVQSSAPKSAKFFRLTEPAPGKLMLSIGPGDHTVQRWEISVDELKGLILDGMPILLR